MRISIIKTSLSRLRVIINSIDRNINYDEIVLSQYFGRNNTVEALRMPYEKDKIEYEFNLSRKLPREIGSFKYIVTLTSEKDTEESRPTKIKFSTSWHVSGMAKKIKHDFYIASKNVNGSKIFIFKKLSSGGVCPECWDDDLESSNDSNCKTCSGSGKIISYSKPVKTYAGPLIYAGVTHETMEAGKELVDSMATVTTDADIILSSDDVLFYVNTSEFYRVDSVTPSLLQSEPVTQQLVVQELPTNSFQSEIPEGEL